jgi:bacterioferritin-associated ferredoxin
MLVCHCKRVSDRVIRAAIGTGASCRDSIGRACGAGTGCGGCHPRLDAILASETNSESGFRIISDQDLSNVG